MLSSLRNRQYAWDQKIEYVPEMQRVSSVARNIREPMIEKWTSSSVPSLVVRNKGLVHIKHLLY